MSTPSPGRAWLQDALWALLGTLPWGALLDSGRATGPPAVSRQVGAGGEREATKNQPETVNISFLLLVESRIVERCVGLFPACLPETAGSARAGPEAA